MMLAVLAVALIGAITLLLGREPSYQGRSLNSWLQQCSDTPLMETQRLAQAQLAVRAIGAERALPQLLKLVRTRDSGVRAWLAAKAERFGRGFFCWRSATELQLHGVAGFEALGTNGAPAIAELTRLLDDKELAFVAARCLEHVGKPAEAALCRCLTNQNWQVRHLSMSALASVTDDVEVYLARIKDGLKDVEPAVRSAAVQSVGAQANASELAVPLLIPVLRDTDDGVCGQTADALFGFGTNALNAFSALTNLLNTGRETQAKAALKALPAIAPVEALPILSNAVVNGSPDRLGTALRSLKTIAPEMTLKMTLNEFHSPNPQRRLVTVGLAAEYDVTTPGIADALKLAAADSDPNVARRATMTMRHLLNKQREAKGIDVHIPNEPSYQGKPLGEWLKMRKEGWELSSNAVEALREMGTNVIPALLARLTYREPVFGLYDYDVSMQAVGALISLREHAKAALPALANLMDGNDSDLALRAMVATLGTGVDAVPCLMKGLTNRSPDVRNQASGYLADQWGSQFR